MTIKGKTNHYNIKFLKGYGFSISVKDSKIILKNCSDPFKEPEVEEWFVNNMPYEKIVISGRGYVSTDAIKLLSEKNVNVILTVHTFVLILISFQQISVSNYLREYFSRFTAVDTFI